MMITANKMS